jgi:hypothetical protein
MKDPKGKGEREKEERSYQRLHIFGKMSYILRNRSADK